MAIPSSALAMLFSGILIFVTYTSPFVSEVWKKFENVPLQKKQILQRVMRTLQIGSTFLHQIYRLKKMRLIFIETVCTGCSMKCLVKVLLEHHYNVND